MNSFLRLASIGEEGADDARSSVIAIPPRRPTDTQPAAESWFIVIVTPGDTPGNC